jgi:hypothetical protein
MEKLQFINQNLLRMKKINKRGLKNKIKRNILSNLKFGGKDSFSPFTLFLLPFKFLLML